MGKILFIANYDEKEKASGINKKIYSQYSALKKNNAEEVYLMTFKNENKIRELGILGIDYKEKYRNRINYMKAKWDFIDTFIKKETIDILYIRYEHFSSPIFLKFLEKNKNLKIFLEIPTYPYDKEYKIELNFRYVKFILDKIYRKNLYKYIDKIVTFSLDKKIWDIPCINISNGIDLERISLIKKRKKEYEQLIFTSVSSCDFWHGIDRFLLSLEKYGEKKIKDNIKFNIVGMGSESEKLKEIVEKSDYLKEIVIFHGFKSGNELEEIYNETDVCVGCLGNHRKGIYTVQALKNKEYMAKGLPMIFSEDDPGIRDKKFVYKAEHNENLLKIEKIIDWYKCLTISPVEIREAAKEFSWDNQMNKVVSYQNGGENK